MKTLLVTVLAVIVALGDEDSCPAFRDWAPWTDKCLWFPLSDIRDEMTKNCDIVVPEYDKLPELPSIPGMPNKCGHCSFKARCRKREKMDGCFPFGMEKQVCDEHGDICDMPRFPKYGLGCKYDFANSFFMQCSARADFPEWKREGMRDMIKMLPEFHCIEKDDKCACCCHPYEPNADGTACVQHNEPECETWGEWNEWSDECVWLPPGNMRDAYATHCDFEVPISDKAKVAYEAFEKILNPVPERCGYCSYKIKCRKRSKLDKDGKKSCFPLEVQKRACGPDDGEGYGEVCDLPKFRDSCNFTEGLQKLAGSHKISSSVKKLPMSMKMGLMKMVSLLPHGDCKEIDDRCRCCCHPYKLSEDGTSCVLKTMCNDADDLGIDYDMNIKADSFLLF